MIEHLSTAEEYAGARDHIFEVGRKAGLELRLKRRPASPATDCCAAHMNTAAANQEKNIAALNSVVAAFLLTGLKVVVGLLSGSLGILAEAAHSGLDFAAAIVTCIAVRAASKPPDRDHAYGHGKVENLSALVETLLLLATCAWIIRESVLRLTSRHVQVDASIWAFAVMGISIAVDFSRSRMLYRVAAKHRSQALEADALHFSTDIWSSAVVILGLLGVKLAGWYPGLGFLMQADAVAALIVAASWWWSAAGWACARSRRCWIPRRPGWTRRSGQPSRRWRACSTATRCGCAIRGHTTLLICTSPWMASNRCGPRTN